jgi:hypothetical protein
MVEMRRRLEGGFAAVVSLQLCAALFVGSVEATPRLSSSMVDSQATAGTWGNAEEVPGSATLNSGGNAGISSISCAAPGNCAAGGQYTDSSRHVQALVVSATAGTWGHAEEIPGTGSLNAGGAAYVNSLSCSAAGDCAASGQYTDASSKQQVFVVTETAGTWGNAKEIPATATLNAGGSADVYTLSCASAGNCAAGGQYTDSSGHTQAFVVNESHGTWGNAEEVPGTATVNALGAAIRSLSCPSAGNCVAGGSFEDALGLQRAFVVNESGGTWGDAKEVPGTATLNAGGAASVASLSCSSAGNCAAGGYYRDHSFHFQAFVVNESGGTWASAKEVPGTATLNAGGSAVVISLSCPSAGNCSAGGSYKDGSGNSQVFVANESGGTWGNAEEMPGMATLKAGFASIYSLSCASAGNCAAGGYYADYSSHAQAFVVNESGGIWASAEEVPGTAVLNAGGGASLMSISCASAGNCSAGGLYKDKSGNSQAFVVNYTPSPTVTGLAPSSGPAGGGTVVTVSGTNLTGASAVRFGTKAGTRVTVVNADSLKVTVPAGTGTIDVTVTTPGGTSAVSSKDRYSYVLPPTVSRLSPASGPTKGGTVIIVYGTHLLGASAVHFGTKAGTHLSVVNATALRVTAPAGTGTVNVTVTSPGGTSAISSTDVYRYT